MALTAGQALDRTALLINSDYFGNTLEAEQIVAGLLATTVRVIATPQDLACPAGQTALVTITALIGMLGLGIDVDIPECEILTPQPPLVGDELRTAVIEHGRKIIPGARIAHRLDASPDVTFALGAAGAALDPSEAVIAVTGGAAACRIGPLAAVAPVPWTGTWPTGAMAATCAAAGEAFRSALAGIAADAGLPYPAMSRHPGHDVVELSIGGAAATAPSIRIGEVDVISAGAITNAVAYSLLRIPGLNGHLRCYDDDILDGTNLNRYALMTQDDIGTRKTDLLKRFSTPDLVLEGVPHRYTDKTDSTAPRILVGADDIPVRWTAQRRQPHWLGIGATGHTYSLVSTHAPDTPCAGCVHDHDDPAPNPVIPTISVVAFMAGLHLAAELVTAVAVDAPAGHAVSAWPLGLGGKQSWIRSPLTYNAACPIHASAGVTPDRAPKPAGPLGLHP